MVFILRIWQPADLWPLQAGLQEQMRRCDGWITSSSRHHWSFSKTILTVNTFRLSLDTTEEEKITLDTWLSRCLAPRWLVNIPSNHIQPQWWTQTWAKAPWEITLTTLLWDLLLRRCFLLICWFVYWEAAISAAVAAATSSFLWHQTTYLHPLILTTTQTGLRVGAQIHEKVVTTSFFIEITFYKQSVKKVEIIWTFRKQFSL